MVAHKRIDPDGFKAKRVMINDPVAVFARGHRSEQDPLNDPALERIARTHSSVAGGYFHVVPASSRYGTRSIEGLKNAIDRCAQANGLKVSVIERAESEAEHEPDNLIVRLRNNDGSSLKCEEIQKFASSLERAGERLRSAHAVGGK